MVALYLVPALLDAQASLVITSPSDGTEVQLGQTLNITVQASGTFQYVTIMDSNPLPLPSPEGRAAPPYQFSIAVPSNIPLGVYYLTASGLIGPGQGVDSPQISINIVGSGTPVLSAMPSSLTLHYAGDRAFLQISAQFPTGPPVDATQSPGTTYFSQDTAVATVDSQGRVTATGPGSTYILVSNALTIPVTVLPPVVVVPPVSRLYAGQSAQFTATLNIADPLAGSVNWSSTPAGVGTLSSTGVYTAPAQIAAQQIVTVTATNADDSTQSASVSVILYPYASTHVSPATATLGQSQTQQFHATVRNAANGNMAVAWSISPSGAGTVDGTGLYTAPATIASTQTVTLTATSVAYGYAAASATITLTPPQ